MAKKLPCKQYASTEKLLKSALYPFFLPAEALFLVFADGRIETFTMGQKWLWFNRRPQSWTALLKRMFLVLFADRNLSPLRPARFFTLIPLSFIEPTLNMTCSSAWSKEFSRKELLRLSSSVLDNLDNGKISVQDPVSVLNWETRLLACRTGIGTSYLCYLPDSCACCTNRKAKKSAIEPICCGCFVAKGAHIWLAWVLPDT